jgi:hypothetical protein
MSLMCFGVASIGIVGTVVLRERHPTGRPVQIGRRCSHKLTNVSGGGRAALDTRRRDA